MADKIRCLSLTWEFMEAVLTEPVPEPPTLFSSSVECFSDKWRMIENDIGTEMCHFVIADRYDEYIQLRKKATVTAIRHAIEEHG